MMDGNVSSAHNLPSPARANVWVRVGSPRQDKRPHHDAARATGRNVVYLRRSHRKAAS